MILILSNEWLFYYYTLRLYEKRINNGSSGDAVGCKKLTSCCNNLTISQQQPYYTKGEADLATTEYLSFNISKVVKILGVYCQILGVYCQILGGY